MKNIKKSYYAPVFLLVGTKTADVITLSGQGDAVIQLDEHFFE